MPSVILPESESDWIVRRLVLPLEWVEAAEPAVVDESDPKESDSGSNPGDAAH